MEIVRGSQDRPTENGTRISAPTWWTRNLTKLRTWWKRFWAVYVLDRFRTRCFSVAIGMLHLRMNMIQNVEKIRFLIQNTKFLIKGLKKRKEKINAYIMYLYLSMTESIFPSHQQKRQFHRNNKDYKQAGRNIGILRCSECRIWTTGLSCQWHSFLSKLAVKIRVIIPNLCFTRGATEREQAHFIRARKVIM